ncbi:MAG: ADP-ribosylation factor-like protein [Promethearchaeota archaeon]
MKHEALDYLISEIMDDEAIRGEDRVEFHDYYKFRVSYITQKSLGIIVLFVTGLTDKFDNIKKELIKCRKEFINLFEEILQHRFDAKTFEVFDPIVDSIHKNLRPKISLIGFSGVGKTTITKLIRAEEIPMQHIPTITGDIATVKIGKLHFHLWDFAGQEQFSYLWDNFIKGSDAALLITDSTLENVEKSKFFLELIKEQSPHAHTAVIGNKQDLEGAINPAQIERVLGLKSYSMIAKDPENRNKMIQIIADVLEMSAEVSPLLKPLLERDKLIEEATGALKTADFEKAAFLFDKISYLCVELGDDSLGKEFYEKSQKIKAMLDQVGAPQPTPAHPIETDRQEQKIVSKELQISKEIITTKPTISIETSEVSMPPTPKLPPQRSTERQVIRPEKPETPTQSIKQSVSSVGNTNVGLQLNPEDFMVKLRPKTLGDVPKDARKKLKTSAFGHVANISQTPKEMPDGFPQPTRIPKEFTPLNTPIPPTEPQTLPQQISTQPTPSPQPTRNAKEFTPLKTPIPPTEPQTLPQQISTQPTPSPQPTRIPKEFTPLNTPMPTTEPQIVPQQISTQFTPSPQPTRIPNEFTPQSTPMPTTESQTIPPPTSSQITPSAQPIKTIDAPKASTPEIGKQGSQMDQYSSPTMEQKQIDHVKKTLNDLKVKKVEISKMALDFEIKEMTGEITKEEFEEKMKRIKEYEERIEKQIQDIQKLLKG